MLPVLFCIAPALLLPFILPQLHLSLSELSPYCSVQFLGDWFLSLSPLLCLQLVSWNCLPLSDLSLSHSQLQSLAALGLLPTLLWCCGLSRKKPLLSVAAQADRCFDFCFCPAWPSWRHKSHTGTSTDGRDACWDLPKVTQKLWKEDISACLFHPYLPLQLGMLQGGAIPAMSDVHDVIQLSSVLALPSVEGCVSTRSPCLHLNRSPGVSGLASSSEELGLFMTVHMAAPGLELQCLVGASSLSYKDCFPGSFSWRKNPNSKHQLKEL